MAPATRRSGASSAAGGRRPARLLLLGASAALAATVAPCCWVNAPSLAGARSTPSRVARSAKDDEKSVTPVVDDSDFGLGDAPKKGGKKKEEFDSLLDVADNFATKKDKIRKRNRDGGGLSLEDDMKGLSLEDDVDLSIGMMKAARSGKVDVSLEGRLGAWLSETKELITNPTEIQITYVIIFWASVVFILLLAGFVVGMGGIRLRGDGSESERRRQIIAQDAFIQRANLLRENKKRFSEVRDKRELAGLPSGQGIGGVDDINYNPPTLPDVPKVTAPKGVFGASE